MGIFGGKKDGSTTTEPKLVPNLPPIDPLFWRKVWDESSNLHKAGLQDIGDLGQAGTVLHLHEVLALNRIADALERIAHKIERSADH